MSSLRDIYIQREQYRANAEAILEAEGWHYDATLNAWSKGAHSLLDVEQAVTIEIQQNISAIMSSLNEGFI